MKTPSLLVVSFMLALFAAGQNPVPAQTTNAPSDTQAVHDREMKMLAFLTPDQQVEYAKARKQALDNDPALKAEGDALIKQSQEIFSEGSAEDKQAFMEKVTMHRQKLRAGMLKVDPTLGPMFTEIDQHLSEMKAKEAAAAPSSPTGK